MTDGEKYAMRKARDVATRIKIGERLRQARGEMTQAIAAKKFGCTSAHLSNIETGRRRICAEYVIDFARIYGVSVEWLLMGDN